MIICDYMLNVKFSLKKADYCKFNLETYLPI